MLLYILDIMNFCCCHMYNISFTLSLPSCLGDKHDYDRFYMLPLQRGD